MVDLAVIVVTAFLSLFQCEEPNEAAAWDPDGKLLQEFKTPAPTEPRDPVGPTHLWPIWEGAQ